MKYLNSDFIFVGISAVTITAFSGLLYADFNKKIIGGSSQEIGKITFKKKVAQRKYSKQVVWEDIEQNSPVFNNDSIRTSDVSEAVINLNDGTAINIEENSLILLAAAKNAININFEQGSISASRSGVEGAELSKINIQSKDATVSIDRSDVTIAKGESDELDLTVSSGSAVVQSGGSEKVVAKDQKVIIDAATKETRIVETKFQLTEPAESSYIISLTDATRLQFKWVDHKDVKEILEISSDRSFSKIIAARDNAQEAVTVSLPQGSYFWRLKALNPQSNKYDYSEIRKFMVLKDAPPVLAYPGDKEKIQFTVKPPLVNFRWRKNDLASSYTIEIASDSAFSQIIQKVQTPLTDISFDNLQAGAYYWRVRTAVTIPGHNQYSAVSRVNTLSIVKNEIKLPPELISPSDGIKISKKIVSDKGITFSWKPDRSVNKYEFELAADPAFTTSVVRTTLTGNFFQYKAPAAAGVIYWRVKGFTGAQTEFLISKQRQINVIEIPSVSLLSPQNQSDFDLKEGEKNQFVHFAWSESALDTGGRYLFEMAGDSNFSNIKYRKLMTKNTISLPNVQNGGYFWRIKILDKDKNEVSISQTYAFTVKEYIKPVVVPEAVAVEVKAPEPEEVKQPEKECSLIIVSPVRGAAIYIDDKFFGYNNVKIKAEPDKSYGIKVKAPGHEDSTQTVVLNKGETREIKPALVLIRKLDRVKWRTRLKTSPSTAVQFFKGFFYLGSSDSTIKSFNSRGKLIWNNKLNGIIKSNLSFTDDTIYAAGTDSNLYSINRSSGQINWKKKISSPLLFGSSPLVYDKKIFAATSSGMMHVFDEKGNQLWVSDLECGIFSSIIFYDRYIFIPTDQYKIIAVDTEKGNVKWECPVKERIVLSYPVIKDKHLYIGDMGGNFYKINIAKEKIVSEIKLDSPIIVNPVFYKNSVVIATEKGFVYNLSADDQKHQFNENWKINAGAAVRNDMNTIGESLILSSDSVLNSIDIKTGKTEWSYNTGDLINTPVVVLDQDIILGLRNGDLVAIRYSIDIVKN